MEFSEWISETETNVHVQYINSTEKIEIVSSWTPNMSANKHNKTKKFELNTLHTMYW
jgi:hypothetical protein